MRCAAAVVGLVKSLANEFGKDGILVNNVGPGFTATDRLKELARSNAASPVRAKKKSLKVGHPTLPQAAWRAAGSGGRYRVAGFGAGLLHYRDRPSGGWRRVQGTVTNVSYSSIRVFALPKPYDF